MPDEAVVQELESLTDYIRREVAAGFTTVGEIAQEAVRRGELYVEEGRLRQHVERTLREEIQHHLQKQATWPEVTDFDRLEAAFNDLENAGIVCRHNFSCCGSCGSAEIWNEIEAAQSHRQTICGYAFYDMQGTESAVEGYGLCLNYGSVLGDEQASVEIGHQIVKAVQAHGLKADWNGSLDTRISLQMDWKRRMTPSE
jgi:hypothetical protein